MEPSIELMEALKFAALNEGKLHVITYGRVDEYRELERAGLIELDQRALGMAITYLTSLGREYLE